MRCVSSGRFLTRYGVAFGLAAYVAALVLGVSAVASGVETFIASIFNAPPRLNAPTTQMAPGAPVAQPQPGLRTAGLILTQDAWADQLRDPAYWASRRVGGNGNKWPSGGSFWKPQVAIPQLDRSNLGVLVQPSRIKPARPERDDGDATYRTVCVRLCDGAFFPLSFSTTREHFEQDAEKCERSCGTSSRLFVYKNPGAEPEDMEDLDGRPYKKLATAFLYKTKYVEQCKCKPHPWEEAASDRHKVYALEAAKAKGSKIADAPLKDLKAKIRQADLEVLFEKKRLAQAKADDQKRAVTEAKASKSGARGSAGSTKTAAALKETASSAATAPSVSVTRGLPPPSTSEPIALYQVPSAPRSGTAKSLAPQSSPQGAVILRVGGAQKTTTGISSSRAPSVAPWRPLYESR